MKKFICIIISCLMLFSLTACKGGGDTSSNTIEKTLNLSLFGQTEIISTKTDGEIAWSNSNSNVIEINANGNKATLIAKSAGETKITATSGDLTETWSIEVTDNGEELYLASKWAGEISMLVDTTQSLEPVITFRGDSFERATIEYDIANPNVATIDEFGTVTAKAVGQTQITAVASYFGRYSNVLTFNVKVAPNTILKTNIANVEIYEPSTQVMFENQKTLLVAIQDGENEIVVDDYQFQSSDSTVASLENGIVKAVSEGQAQITVSVEYKGQTYTTTIQVSVLKIPTLSITIDKSILVLYTSVITSSHIVESTINATTLLNGDISKDVKLSYSISDGAGVVSVNQAGLVQSVSAGKAVVNVTATYGEMQEQASCKIYVLDSNVGKAKFDGDIITLLNKETGSYEKLENGNYLYSKTGHMSVTGLSSRKELLLELATYATPLFEKDNYIIIELKSNSIGYVLHGTNNGYDYEDYYNSDFSAKISTNRPVADTWINAVWKIGKLPEAVSGKGDTIGNGAEGSVATPATWEIKSVTICTSEEFNKLFSTG